MMREKCSYSFLRSLVKGQDHSFFKNLTGVFCAVGGTLVVVVGLTLKSCHVQNMLLYIESTEKLIYAHHKQVKVVCYHIKKES
jgi:hypothetical protein